MVQLFKRAGDKTSNYKSRGGHPHVKGRKREREGLAGDKDALNMNCRINNYSVWMCKGPAMPPDHFWCINTV